MSYRLVELRGTQGKKEFYQVCEKIYKGDLAFVAPLEVDIEGIFDPTKNAYFIGGKAKRWVLFGENNEPIGRIAAFYNLEKSPEKEYPLGGIGFFECINDSKAAFSLFDVSAKWLKSEGIKAIEGPVNFGANHRYWGLLVHGFTHPSFGMNYNPSYYQSFFERYGFGVYFEQISKHLDLNKPFPERFFNIVTRLKKRGSVSLKTPTDKNLLDFGDDFLTIFNDAWKLHKNFREFEEADLLGILNSIKPILINKFLIFSYVKGEPAGFILALPDINQILKEFGGKMSIIDKLKFLWRKRNDFEWYRKRKILTRLRVMIIGVRPGFQRMGLESALAISSLPNAIEMGFEEVELSWVGEFNPMSRKLQDATKATLGKIHNTYRISLSDDVVIRKMESVPSSK